MILIDKESKNVEFYICDLGKTNDKQRFQTQHFKLTVVTNSNTL